MPPSIDLFCRVVDNFGDIGVCWRFARALSRDQGCKVRLFVDDFAVFAKIEQRLDPTAQVQTLDGAQVLHWTDGVIAAQYGPPSDAVIEAFACHLPDLVVERMAKAYPAPVWLDLEYLSAEDWVEDNHAIPSMHPTTGLTKTLFFPGVTEKTGGLTRESGLIPARNAFQSDKLAQNTWRAAHSAPLIAENAVDISLFCYPNAPIAPFVAHLAGQSKNFRVIVPEGVAAEPIGALTSLPDNVEFHIIPFLTQDDYDRLLWTCDLNFVRGEDSFTRAIWAAKPFIWQIYRQDKFHHLVKLNAFLEKYSRSLPPGVAESLAKFTVMWNEGGLETDDASAVSDLIASLPDLGRNALDWADRLAGQQDLATQVVSFIRDQAQRQKT